MSLMSTGRAGLSAAVGAEFMAPGTWAAGAASCGTAGPAAEGCGCQTAAATASANERGVAGVRRGLRITELHFRELHVREVRTSGPGVAAPRVTVRGMAEPGIAVSGMAAHAPGRPGPIRLTRRGRAVVAALTILAATAVVLLLWLSLAGGAQASSHGQLARAGYRGMTQIVVRPGQTLWSLAAAAEPSADPRIVIQQIIDANALGGTTIRAGELLWVPVG
jgi:hypothetical protein